MLANAIVDVFERLYGTATHTHTHTLTVSLADCKNICLLLYVILKDLSHAALIITLARWITRLVQMSRMIVSTPGMTAPS